MVFGFYIQENVYYKDKFPFISFRKCLLSSSDENMATGVELISFHSASKGIFAECGLRGGYFELNNIDESGVQILTKLASINLCPNTIGQAIVEIMVNPPVEGDESFALFQEEYKRQYESLQERAKIVSTELNKIDGMTCNTVFGALYAFANIHLPEEIVVNVKKANDNKTVDFVYCLELLESYGICVVPGSGFGQKENTYHFRTTILPPKTEIERVVKCLGTFHQEFVQKYSS